MMEHTHAHEYSHTQRPSHTPACTCTQLYPQLTLSVPIHTWPSHEQPGMSTHTAHVLTPKALPTQSSRCRAGYVHIHVPGFTHTILSFANAHIIHACAHTSYVGLCQRAHTHRLHTIPYKCLPGHACAGTRTTQIPRALPELVGQPLHGWSRLPPPPPLHKGHSTQDSDGGAHTQVSGLSGCEGKRRGASRERWSGGAPPPSQARGLCTAKSNHTAS